MLPLLLATGAMTAGGLAQTAMGQQSANQSARATADAYNDFGRARNAYAEDVAGVQSGLQETAGKATADWRALLSKYLDDTPDAGQGLADLYTQRQGAMKTAGQQALTKAPAGGGKGAWMRALAADRDRRLANTNAPGAFQGAMSEQAQAEVNRQLGLTRGLGDIQRGLGRAENVAALRRQFAYEPYSLAQARMGPAMQQAGQAGSQSALIGSLAGLGGSVGGTVALAAGAK